MLLNYLFLGMFNLLRALLILALFASFSTIANSETSWITKKSDKSKTEIKKEKKEKKAKLKKKTDWIKKKQKETKKEYKKEKELVTKEEKNWIKKKNKQKPLKKVDYILEAKFLPKADYYFKINNLEKNQFYHGYLNLVNQEKVNADGYTFIQDNETGKGIVCNITSTYTNSNKIKIRIWSNCTDKSKNFTGTIYASDKNYADDGRLKSDNGENLLIDFFTEKEILVASIPKDPPVRTAGGGSPPKIPIIVPEGKYYALIIANSTYDNKEHWSDLVSPSNDAKAIKKIFDKKYKFHKTWLFENASRGKIYEEFEKLKSIITEKDYLLIYYSGHGQTDINNVAYWIPEEGNDKYYTWVNVNALTNTLENIKAKHILFMIDSCYSGLTFKSQSIVDKDLVNDQAVIEEALLYYSRKVLTSGSGKKRVLDAIPGEKHSLFAKGFIKELEENKGNLRAEQIWQRLKYYHKGKTIKQVPAFGTIDALSLSDSNGDFVFHIPVKK